MLKLMRKALKHLSSCPLLGQVDTLIYLFLISTEGEKHGTQYIPLQSTCCVFTFHNQSVHCRIIHMEHEHLSGRAIGRVRPTVETTNCAGSCSLRASWLAVRQAEVP